MIQIGGQAFRGSWREPQGPEYTRIWDYMVSVYPPYTDYQAGTTRKIPIVVMRAAESIPAFKA